MKKLYMMLIAVVLILLTACSESALQNVGNEVNDGLNNLKDSNNKYVQMVKDGYQIDNPDMTYEKAFSSFFGTPRWTYIQSNEGDNVVEFIGDCTYQDVPVKARIQFVVDEENSTFEATYLAFNEVPQNLLMLYELLETAFEETTSVDADSQIFNVDVSPDNSKIELDNYVKVEYISLNIPSSWDYSYDGAGGYISFEIDCRNESVSMSVFESRDTTDDLRSYIFDGAFSLEKFTFDYDIKEYYAYDDTKILFTSGDGDGTVHYFVDYSAAPEWYHENKELIYDVARTIYSDYYSYSKYLGEVLYNGSPVYELFDLTIYDIIETLGAPIDKGYWNGGEYYEYDDGIKFIPDFSTGQINHIVGSPSIFEVDDVTLDKNRAGLIALLGNPTDEYWGDDYEPYMIYEHSNYSIWFSVGSPDDAPYSIRIWISDSSSGEDD